MSRTIRVCCCFLLFLGCLSSGDSAAQATAGEPSGEAFATALAERLELDWNACPEPFEKLLAAATGDVRCAVIGKGEPIREAERLALMQARSGGRVLDIEYNDGLPAHLYAGMAGLRAIAPVSGYRRQVYLIGEQRVSMWIQILPTALVEGGDPERWMAIRVDELDGPFPDYMPAGQARTRPAFVPE